MESVPPIQNPSPTPTPTPSTSSPSPFHRTSLQIPSSRPGWNLDTWVYLPTLGTSPYPIVIMANGFGLTKSLGLSSYAEAFARAGYACLVFDYRRWGLSDGIPRNALFISEQVGDYRTAVEFVKKDSRFDSDRIVLWGFSFAGGHVLTLSAEYGHTIKASITQSPYLGRQLPFSLTLTYFKFWFFALLDLFKQTLGFSPVYIPITAHPGEIGNITAVGAVEGFYSLTRDPKEFENKVSASTFLRVPTYKPIRTIHKIKVPILFVVSENDVIRPPKGVLEAAALVRGSEVLHLKGGHFDMFSGGIDFEKSVESQVGFLRRHVPIVNV